VEHFHVQSSDDAKPSIDHRPLVVAAHQGEVSCLRFIEPGSLATCGTDGLIRIWDLAANASLPINLTDSPLHNLQLSPDGELLLSTAGREIIIFNVKRGEVVSRSVGSQGNYESPVWSSTGDKAIVSNHSAGVVVILDRNGRTISSIAHEGPSAAAISPDGSLIAIISANQLQICRADTGQNVFRQPISTSNPVVGFSRDGARLAYGGHTGPITILEIPHMRMVGTLSCGSGVCCPGFSPDDSIIASGHSDSVIRLWDAQTGDLKAALAGQEQSTYSIAFSPDGHTLLSSADDAIVRIWSVDQGRGYGVVWRRFDLGSPIVRCVLSLSTDGSRLAIGYKLQQGRGPDVLLWDLRRPSHEEFHKDRPAR
jgi:WD40 repeat protein